MVGCCPDSSELRCEASRWKNAMKSGSVNGGIPSSKLTWQWKITIFNREYIFNRSILHCHVSLPEGTGNHSVFQSSALIEIVFEPLSYQSVACFQSAKIQNPPCLSIFGHLGDNQDSYILFPTINSSLHWLQVRPWGDKNIQLPCWGNTSAKWQYLSSRLGGVSIYLGKVLYFLNLNSFGILEKFPYQTTIWGDLG